MASSAKTIPMLEVTDEYVLFLQAEAQEFKSKIESTEQELRVKHDTTLITGVARERPCY